MKTAACCIIGDEILSGKTKDTNSHYLAKTLFDLGIELKCIRVIGDDAQDIIRTVKELSLLYDIVFTSGGIGPTHDDITYESIATAYNLEMKVDQTTFNMIMKYGNKNYTLTEEYARHLATFPFPAILLRENKKLMIPVVVVNENIYILPGIPALFQLLLDTLGSRLSQNTPYYRLEIATEQPEMAIATILRKIQQQVQHVVKIGSYPTWQQEEEKIKVIVTVTGQDKSKVKEISQWIQKEIRGWPHRSRL
ncbi:MoaB/Mog domain-containing protein [Cokeromyces recurvatus]|uniref:MoaB/Mog domain-containing protein n=1 Tax=Cokeromyces recurvatus TaxID=90255 RepID=UPI00221EF8C9|nr:MoaB/Mog domain-containing protein [Cokeromyces recurvatus]KAI7902977.1 MoaB/Mog domain-containing protein [Cokeromyces recurvatus]